MVLNKLSFCHLTSVHDRNDTRIWHKMCISLAEAGAREIYLVLADGKGDRFISNVNVRDVGMRRKARISRMYDTVNSLFEKAVSLDCDIYHLHDPELIPVALKLKKMGKKVIFDAHEDVSKDILSKEWIPFCFRYLTSVFYSWFERWACPKLDGVIGATPWIKDKYVKMGCRSVDINNYPLLGELSRKEIDWSAKENNIAYIGGIARIRGIYEIVDAIGCASSGARLQLAGKFSDRELRSQVVKRAAWKDVDELGFLDRDGVRDVLLSSVAGLVTLHPTINYLESLPVKMFEYMSAGVPVIASNFPLWRKIIEENNCGVLVDPLNPQEIAEAIDFFVNNPIKAEAMGRNGQKAVKDKYNWVVEKQKLISFYQDILELKSSSD